MSLKGSMLVSSAQQDEHLQKAALPAKSPRGGIQCWEKSSVFTTWPALSDAAATAKMNSLAAGAKATAIGPPQSAVISGRNFVASEFELNEPPLVKHAKIFTTNCKGQLVAFVFVSNSAAKISAMEESLKTLDFSKP